MPSLNFEVADLSIAVLQRVCC